MYRQEKEEILTTARKLMSYGIVRLSAGNLSVRRGEHVIVTPSGMEYEGLDSSDMVVVDMKGNVVEGERMPSLDTVGLLYIYNHIPRIQALIHTHQVYATAVSLIAEGIPAIVVTQSRRGARPGTELHTAIEELKATLDLRAFQQAHAGGVLEEGGSVLRPSGVTCGGQTEIERADFIKVDAAGQSRPRRECSQRTGQAAEIGFRC